MRRISWASVLLAALGAAGLAAGSGTSLAGQFLGGGHVGCAACSAEPCAAPCGYNWAQGCCQCQPNCCDNAWAGYCQQKARWQSFWSRLGTGPRACGAPVAAGCAEGVPCQAPGPPMPGAIEPGMPVGPAPPPSPQPAPALKPVPDLGGAKQALWRW